MGRCAVAMTFQKRKGPAVGSGRTGQGKCHGASVPDLPRRVKNRGMMFTVHFTFQGTLKPYPKPVWAGCGAHLGDAVARIIVGGRGWRPLVVRGGESESDSEQCETCARDLAPNGDVDTGSLRNRRAWPGPPDAAPPVSAPGDDDCPF